MISLRQLLPETSARVAQLTAAAPTLRLVLPVKCLENATSIEFQPRNGISPMAISVQMLRHHLPHRGGLAGHEIQILMLDNCYSPAVTWESGASVFLREDEERPNDVRTELC